MKMLKNLTLKYSLQHFIYWSATCGIVSFAATYLLSQGFTAAAAGRILFMANFCSFLLQPLVAGKADRSEKNLIPAIMLTLIGITMFCFVCIRFLPVPSWLFPVLYVVGMTSLDMEVPLLNAENVYYTDRGWTINYGLARAVGSAAYAVLSLSLGYIIEYFGADWMPVIAVAFTAGFAVVTLCMPKDNSASLRSRERGETVSLPVFFRKYKWYCVSLLGILLLALFHVMVENYLIEILNRLGGDSSGVGIALCVATVIEVPGLIYFAKFWKKAGTYKVVLIAGLSYCLKGVFFLLARSVTAIYLAQLLQLTTYTLISPVQMYYAKECTSEADMVKGQSVITASFALGCALGNLFGGQLITTFGVPVMLAVSIGVAAFGTASLAWTVPKALSSGNSYVN